MREGVLFHDGTLLTAQHVAQSLDRSEKVRNRIEAQRALAEVAVLRDFGAELSFAKQKHFAAYELKKSS